MDESKYWENEFETTVLQQARDRYEAEQGIEDIVERAVESFEMELRDALQTKVDDWFDEDCSECDGTGLVSCETCDGSGEVDCAYCEGSAPLENDACEGCEGTGTYECPDCKGEGEVGCTFCDETGKAHPERD